MGKKTIIISLIIIIAIIVGYFFISNFNKKEEKEKKESKQIVLEDTKESEEKTNPNIKKLGEGVWVGKNDRGETIELHFNMEQFLVNKTTSTKQRMMEEDIEFSYDSKFITIGDEKMKYQIKNDTLNLGGQKFKKEKYERPTENQEDN